MKKSKLAVFQSIMALILCLAMLTGTTFAWFSDTETTGTNIIKTGDLRIAMSWTNDMSQDPVNWQDASNGSLFNYQYWEPGFTDLKYLKVDNIGNLAFQYQMEVIPFVPDTGSGTAAAPETLKLAEAIDVYVGYVSAPYLTREEAVAGLKRVGTLSDLMNTENGIYQGILLPENGSSNVQLPAQDAAVARTGSETVCIMLKMREDAGNEYMNCSAGDGFCVRLSAVQYTYEVDSFGNDYDSSVRFPELINTVYESAAVTVDNGVTSAAVTMGNADGGASVPAGVKVADGTTQLELSITSKPQSDANVTLDSNEELRALDVHMEGVSPDNTVPMVIYMGPVMPVGLNTGNLKLYHVENGTTNLMTQKTTAAEVANHNDFYYDPATGNLTVAMATFSEITLVADLVNAWKGTYDYSWYDASKTEFIIANADQLAGFGAIVGGMNGQTQDSFSGKTVKLASDINLGDDEDHNNEDLIFYPIGYYNSTKSYEKNPDVSVTSGIESFEGTFDGAGHTISNFYQNTWEMFGDYNDGYSGKPNHYKDAMGLFGYVLNGKVTNLTVDNFSSDGEFTPTGVIAAYAVNSTFENIAITNCNPRVYNTGNGGIIGIAGQSNDTGTITLRNITVDNSNKISALWGSWDVACGGLVGMFRGNADGGNGKIHFENCHVSAQIDVNNDVCANYQYYAYRYAGMIIGSIRHNTTNSAGQSIPNMAGITASGCTVNYGNWNDYYYCELVANSLASYTHDHQFSRLTRVKAVNGTSITYLDGTTGTVPSTGRYNYVVVNGAASTENAVCYHFVDGSVWNHADAGTETVGGTVVQKEDKQHIYLPFDQMFTGYGWGVNSQSIDELAGIENLGDGISKGDQEESVPKFIRNSEFTEVTVDNEGKLTITVGSLFAENPDVISDKIKVQDDAVQVAVTGLNDSGITATYTASTTGNWEDGTLTFNKIEGMAAITIQDYNFCKPTTIVINNGQLVENVEKFAIKLPNYKTYLYRIGNLNAVEIGYLFEETGEFEVIDADVTVEITDENGNSIGEFKAATPWESATINIADSFTGLAKVTISEGGSFEKVLNLEVVKAQNIVDASGATGKNLVLLDDVTFTGSYLYYKDMTLYGNGFEIDITGADHSDLRDISDTNSNKSAYCNIWMVDSTFDNVRIKGSVYPEVGMTADSNYGNAAIRTEGDCYIYNSYVSNCRVPLRVQGNTTVENTVVDGGRYANIELRSGKLTLDGVTTINTVRKGSDGTTDVIGFGIVIHDEAANASIAVVGDGLKQNNWVGENKHKDILSKDANLNSAYKLVFNANNSDSIYFDYNGDRYVNTGIICLCADMTKGVVTGLDDRYCQEVSGYDAWVLTYDNSKHTDWFNESVGTEEVAPNPDQNAVLPTYTGNEAQTVEFTKGETYYFDTSVLTAEKNGNNLTISSVVMNGTTYSYGDKIPLTEGGVYEVAYTVVDPYNYNADATETTTVNHTVSITVTAIAKDAEILAPKFTFIDQNGNKYEATTVKAGDKTYVMPNVTAADPTTNSMSSINIGSASISGTTVYFPVATGYTVRSGSNFNRYYPLFNGINITDYTIAGDTTGTTYTTSGNYTSLVGSSGTKFIIPANGGQTNCGDYVKTDGQAGNAAGNSDSGWQGAGYSTSYGGTYLKSGNTNASRGADSNGYERIVWVEYCFNAGNGDVYYYRIGYHCNKEAAQTCVTPDTLITLADGTQKRIDEATYDDTFLVWDFVKGEYTTAPASIVMNHGYDKYTVVELNFSDGTTVKTINGHGFYHQASNEFVILSESNAQDYIAQSFVKQDGTSVKLVSYEVREEYTESWSVLTAEHYNCILEGMLTITPAEVEGTPEYLMPFVVGEGMKYDEAAMQADIEKYGLYTYADFADYMSYEQFAALNLPIFKVAVGKGYITYEEIMYLINIHIG